MNNQEYNRQRYENAKKAYAALMKFYPLTLEDLPEEVWLPVPDFDKYQVSNFGRVKSFRGKTPRILRPACRNGYLLVTFNKNGARKHFSVHRLVAQVFIPNPEGKPEVNHVDGIKLNNHVSNLEWCTSTENQRHAVDTGLQVILQGEDIYNAKLTNEQARFIRENPDDLNQYELAVLFGVTNTTISNVQLGKIYKSAGGTSRPANPKSPRVPDNIRSQIRAEYQKGVVGCGRYALAKKYGIAPATIIKIVKEA